MTVNENRDEILKRKTTNFKVTKIPVWALREFKKFCKEECGDVYAVGIIQLLKIKKYYEDMMSPINSLQKQIDDLKQKQSTEKKELKTFGE